MNVPLPLLSSPCCSKQGVEKKARKEREKPHKKGERKTKEDPPERKEGKERRKEGGFVGLERDLQFGKTTENGVETRVFRVCLLKSLYFFSVLLAKLLYVPWSFLGKKKKKTLFMFSGDS